MRNSLKYLLLLPLLSSSTLMADSLTGAINYLSAADGTAGPANFWNTNDADGFAYNLYLFNESSPTSNANVINPNGTQLNYNLGLGVHDLVFVGSNGPFVNTAPNFTLSLFFEGGAIPGISAVWDSVNNVFVGGGDCTNGRDILGASVPCGGLTYTGVDGNLITLTALSMQSQPVDIIGGFSEMPDAINDQFTQFQLTVSAVPVPSAVWLFASGLIGMVGIARRRF